MQWKSDLESLVEQTKAMVRSANLKSGELAQADPVRPPREPSVEMALSRLTPATPPHAAAAAFPPRVTAASPPHSTAASREREDIRQRVAGFKAQQEKLRREREQYYLEMTAKTRAMLRDGVRNEK